MDDLETYLCKHHDLNHGSECRVNHSTYCLSTAVWMSQPCGVYWESHAPVTTILNHRLVEGVVGIVPRFYQQEVIAGYFSQISAFITSLPDIKF